MNGKPRLLWAAGARLGEGPVWDDRIGRLWWIDIRGHQLHQMDAAGGSRKSWTLPQAPGFLALTNEPGRIILGLQAGVFRFEPETGQLESLAVPEGHSAEHRLNDGKVDPMGCLWFGTMHAEEHPSEGALHCLDPAGGARRMDGPFTVPNGPAFSPDGEILYCADSPARVVYACRLEEGLARKQVFARFAEAEGYPDGMTVDAAGCLWVAHWDGGCVSRFAPDGRRLAKIGLPTAKVTSCAFGGADLRTLFITTAGGPGALELDDAGGMFMARTAAAGIPSGQARLG